MDFTNNIYKQFFKGSIWKKILVVLVIILIYLMFTRCTSQNKEGFVQLENFSQIA